MAWPGEPDRFRNGGSKVMAMGIGLPDLWEFLAYEKKQKLDCIKQLFRLCLGERESIRRRDLDSLVGILTRKREILRELDEIESAIAKILGLVRAQSGQGIEGMTTQPGKEAMVEIHSAGFAEVISLDTEIMVLMHEVCAIEQENNRSFYEDVEGSAKKSVV